jgi:hypothetical protein
MTWVKIDDGFTDHPKIEGLSDRAFRLHIAGLCFCGRTLSDGHIPTDRVRRLLPKVTKAMVAELEEAGTWIAVTSGFVVKDYLTYNPSRKKVMEDREAAAERKRKWAEKKAEDAARKKRDAEKNASRDALQNDAPALDPSPPRPKGQGSGHMCTAGGATTTTGAKGAEQPDLVLTDEIPDTSLDPQTVEQARAAIRALRSVPDLGETA